MADMFDDELMAKLWETLAVMKAGKPTERSEKARRYAVAITEMEKVVAYYKTYVVDELG